MIYLQLILSYLKIGFLGFGGGYAMLSFIYYEVVTRHAWISAAELADIIAISQMTPGPIAINSATYIGYTVAGFWGAVLATVAVCTPAMTLMVLITRFFIHFKDNRFVASVVYAMRPVVLGMIGAAALLMIMPAEDPAANSFVDGWSWALFIAAFLAAASRKIGLVWIIVISAILGILIYA